MRASSKPLLYFYCNALPEPVRIERRITSDSPAATRKIIAMSRALQTAGTHVVVISMARSANRTGAFHPARVTRMGGVPVIVGPLLEVPVFSQILSAFWLAWMALRVACRGRSSRHLFYNQMSLYLPALLALSVRRAATVVDIEDGPLSRRSASYARRGSNASALFGRLITHGAILATSRLSDGTPIRPVQVCYGAVAAPREVEPGKFSDGPLRIMLAGFINRDTGQAQFEQAIALMRAENDPIYDDVIFEVAGTGPGIEEMRPLSQGIRPQVALLGRLDAGEYAALLERSHIGLSLKRVGGAVSESTFPSKTVEIAENGLALIATDISDVRAVFDAAAWYLVSDNPEELVGYVRLALSDRDAVLRQARLGRDLVASRFSYAAVGRTLATFLHGDRQ
jgi:glycosyltransferase involved in cell wall biosynthesis